VTGTEREKGPATMDDSRATQIWAHRTREVVAVFVNPAALESAVKRLRAAGFHASDISVLGSDEQVRTAMGQLYRSVLEIEDNPHAPRADFVPGAVRYAGEVASVALPLYIGGLLGAAAVVASGGALALAVAATIVGSAGGATLGGLLAEAVARHHANRVEQQLARGGMALWVKTAGVEQERRAAAISRHSGGRDVHVHEIHTEWSRRTS
jgi:hypothetical protein